MIYFVYDLAPEEKAERELNKVAAKVELLVRLSRFSYQRYSALNNFLRISTVYEITFFAGESKIFENLATVIRS